MACSICPCSYAQQNPTTWIDDHETPEPYWQNGGGSCTHEILLRRRESGNAMSGSVSEHITLRCQNDGDSAFLVYRLKPVLITNEMLPSLGVYANRSGIKLMARVVLPRTPDPDSGRATTFHISGGTYSTPNRWQRLRIDHTQSLVAQEIQRLRQKWGDTVLVDTRGAYLDYLFVDAYTGPGDVEIYLDSLEFASMVPAVPTHANPVPAPVQEPVPTSSPEPVSMEESAPPVDGATVPRPSAGTFDIQLPDTMLTIDGTPIFVRAVRYQGEPLAVLHEIGFNTVWLPSPPTIEMEQEATLLKMWFICPPPVRLDDLSKNPADAVDVEQMRNRSFGRVLIWDLGQPPQILRTPQETVSSLELARRQIRFLKKVPRAALPDRPNIVAPVQDCRNLSTVYDILLIDRNPLNSTMDFVAYGYWFRQVKNLVRMKRPLWSVVPTQYDILLKNQWRQVAVTSTGVDGAAISVPDTLPVEQLRLMAYSAVMAGSQGLLFESNARLDTEDQETEFRRKALTLVNLELLMMEQWLSQGDTFVTIPSDRANVVGAVLGAAHVKILIPLYLEPNSQYVTQAGAARRIRFIVPGLPSTYQCWKYSPDGLVPIPHRKVAGGVAIELDELPLVTTIVMTSNPTITTSLSHRIRLFSSRIVRTMQELAELRLRSFLQFHGSSALTVEEQRWYDRAKNSLEASRRSQQYGDFGDAFLQAQRALRPIGLLEGEYWKEKISPQASPNEFPTSVSFRSLELQERWFHMLGGLSRGENILPGGGFESAQEFVTSGWMQIQNTTEIRGIVMRADLSREAAKTGEFGIQMEIRTDSPRTAPCIFDAPPITIRSPTVPADRIGPPGTIYQVEAWVCIPKKLVNSVEGLKISDSNSGDVLAERVIETVGWKKISYQRVMTNSEPVTITISLSGYGKAWVDDVQIIPWRPNTGGIE